MDRVLALHAGSQGFDSHRGHMSERFSDPIDQDIRTQWALSWKIVVSEWRSMIAVSLNVGSGVRLIKPAKLCMCTQHTINETRTDARRRVCAAMVPYRWATRGTSLRELEYTHKHTPTTFRRTHGDPYRGYGYVPLRFGGNVARRTGTQQQSQHHDLGKYSITTFCISKSFRY